MSKKENSNFTLKGKVVFFATGNINKFNEARSVLSQYGISVGMLRLKGEEIQNDSLKEIAQSSVRNAYNKCFLPIFVEDAGLFIDSLSGFPGPYSAYVYRTINNVGILKLMNNLDNRYAKFRSVIAYCDDQILSQPLSFEGESKGEITLTEMNENGKSGFGFDPIFQPDGSKKTFAQMNIEEKNNFSHRAIAIHKFAKYYSKKLTKP